MKNTEKLLRNDAKYRGMLRKIFLDIYDAKHWGEKKITKFHKKIIK